MPMKGPCPVMVNIPPRLAALLLVNPPSQQAGEGSAVKFEAAKVCGCCY